MPLLETFANASKRGWFPAVATGDTGAYDLLATTLVSSDVASVTFDTSTYAALGYKHLQIRVVARLSTSFDERTINMRVNSDSGNNYTAHYVQSTGSSVISNSEGPTSKYNLGSIPAANATGSAFGTQVIDILDAFSTSKTKTVRVFVGNQTNSVVAIRTGAWLGTSAITSLQLAEYFSSSNFVSGSRLSIYGLKG